MDRNYQFNGMYTNFPRHQAQQPPSQPFLQPQHQLQNQHQHQHLPSQSHAQSYSSPQFRPQPHPPPQSYNQPHSYPQSLPPQPLRQNYPQHYYNQDQSYQSPLPQYQQQPFYQAPQPSASPPQPRVQVVIPPRPSPSLSSLPSPQQLQQQRQQFHQQPTPQINQLPSPVQSFQQSPREQVHQGRLQQPPQPRPQLRPQQGSQQRHQQHPQQSPQQHPQQSLQQRPQQYSQQYSQQNPQQPPQQHLQYRPQLPPSGSQQRQQQASILAQIPSPNVSHGQAPPVREPQAPLVSEPEVFIKQELAPPTIKSEEVPQNMPGPGSTINPQMLMKPPQPKPPKVLQAVEINTKPKQISSKMADYEQKSPKPDELEPDYTTLLCVLADDYIDAARKLPTSNEEYYTLIATAIGCLESVLNNFKLPPLKEAQISIRYAQLLYEETENYDEAETTLTKAIEICERHKFVDLKYEIQLLLCKVLYESRPKAALREMQRMIDDIEAYRHTVWLYIFRFQHAMFSLASAAPGEVHNATVQLEKITSLARQNSDSAVLAFAAVVEALLHLSSSSHEAVTATQTALAKARALQSNLEVERNPQLTIFMEFLDLACSVQEANITQIEDKRKVMQNVLYDSISDTHWRDDGFIYLPISKRAIAGIEFTGTGHVIERGGRYFLTFSWLSKAQVEVLGYLFSADSTAYKSGTDGGKAEKFALEGLSDVQNWGWPKLSAGYQQSQRVNIFQKLVECQYLFLICFMRCGRGLWQQADDMLVKIEAIASGLGNNFPLNMKSALSYLQGAVLQGTGNTTEAIEIYQSPILSFDEQKYTALPTKRDMDYQISSSYHAESDVTRNFCILAAMNSAFILRDPHHPQHNRLSSLVNRLGPIVQQCGNKYIQAHYSLLVSFLANTTLTAKQYLKSAMEAAKAIGSTQTTALALIYMQEKLFRSTVDEQALKCARAASHQVRRWGDPLWMHVVAGLEAEALEVNGFIEDAQHRRADAAAGWEDLQEGIKG